MSVGGDRRAGPRPGDHGRRLRAVRLRGDPGHGHRHPDHPRLLALRHRRRLRQGPREHQEPRAHPADLRRGGEPRGQPDPGPVDQHLDRGAAARSARSSTSASCQLGLGCAQGPRARAVRRHGGRCLLLDLHRHPALVQLKELRARGSRPATRARCGTAARKASTATPSVPAFTEDMPVAGRARAPSRRAARPAATTAARAGVRPARRRARGPARGRERPAVAAGVAVGVGQARSSRRRKPRSQAGQEVTAARPTQAAATALEQLDPSTSPTSREPGVVFKDITPLLADHDALHRGRRRAGRRRPGRRRAPSWSTRWSAWRPAGSSSPRRSRWPSAPGSCRCARPASCRATTHAVSYALEYGEATLEVHQDAHRAGRAGAARRRRARHRRHRRRDPAARRARAAASCTRVAVLMELSFLAGRDGHRRPAAAQRCTTV